MRSFTQAVLAFFFVLATCRAAHAEADDEASIEAARARFTEAVGLADQGRFSEALAIFREVQADRPHPAVIYNIGWCLSQLDRVDEAIDAFEAYIAAGDDDAERLTRALAELERLRGLANENDEVEENDIEPEDTTATEPDGGVQEPQSSATERRTRRRLRPALFWSLLGLSLVTGAAMTGTGVATLSVYSDVTDQWDADDRSRGLALQDATDGLLGVLIGEVVATLIVGLFTDFGRAGAADAEDDGL